MSKPGPKPTPTNLRMVKGSDRPDRMNPEEPQAPVTIPDAPAFLQGDEIAVFADTAGKLARMRVMSDADLDALTIYAVNFVRWKYATEKVRDDGLVIEAPNKFPMPNPYLGIANKAQDQCLKILTEFGLTPSSRTRVKAT